MPLVSRGDPLANRAEIDYDEIGDRAVSDLPTFPREMMDVYIPPVTPSGRRLRRVVSRTTEEAMMRVATGQQVHPTVNGWLDHHAHPGVVAVPLRDLPPSETGLAWLTAIDSPRVQAFVEAAADVLAHSDSPHERGHSALDEATSERSAVSVRAPHADSARPTGAPIQLPNRLNRRGGV